MIAFAPSRFSILAMPFQLCLAFLICLIIYGYHHHPGPECLLDILIFPISPVCFHSRRTLPLLILPIYSLVFHLFFFFYQCYRFLFLISNHVFNTSNKNASIHFSIFHYYIYIDFEYLRQKCLYIYRYV